MLKAPKFYLGVRSTCRAVGNVKTGRAPGGSSSTEPPQRESHQYLRLLSPSDMLFIVKSGTSLDLSLVRLLMKIHLTLRDSVRCIGSSSREPERLWRWPWERTGSYFSLHVKVGWGDGSGYHGGVCVIGRLGRGGEGLRITDDADGLNAPSECCCCFPQMSRSRFILWMQALPAAVLISTIVSPIGNTCPLHAENIHHCIEQQLPSLITGQSGHL